MVAAIAGCASLPRLAPPEVRVDTVRIDRLDAGGAGFALTLDVLNPNDVELVVEALEAELRIEGIAAGTTRLSAPAQLPAFGRTAVTLDVRAQFAAALRVLAAVAHRLQSTPAGRMAVGYAVSGVATLGGGRQIPFRRDGELPWPGRRAGPGT